MPLILLIALHGLITLTYAALSNSREPLLREQSEANRDIPPRLNITYQLSLLLVRFAIAAVAVTAVENGFVKDLPPDNQHITQVALDILVLTAVGLITFIFGDLVPEAIGSTRADKLGKWVISPIYLLVGLMSPLVTVIVAVSRWLAGVFGSSDKVNVVTEEEIMTMLNTSEKEGGIENAEKEMIYSVLQFGDRLVREVMIPRIDVVAIDIDTTVDEALQTFIENGHSRLPLYEETIDNIKGLLYAKDLLNIMRKENFHTKPLRELMRKAFFVPESKRAELLLKELRHNKIHMAVVVDEYGGTAGIITIEDLLEEIVGDIQDEYDLHEEAEFTQQGPNVYVIDASMSLNDFNDLLEVELPTEESDTLGGFVFTTLGHVPDVGESLEFGNLTLRVETIEGRRLRKIHVVRKVVITADDQQAVSRDPSAAPVQPITE